MWIKNLEIKTLSQQWKPKPFSYSMIDNVALTLNKFET